MLDAKQEVFANSWTSNPECQHKLNPSIIPSRMWAGNEWPYF